MDENPDGPFALGLAAFHAGEFFAAHEHWEDCWRALPQGDDRLFVQGLIHAAVALYQQGRGNARGARSQLGKARHKLRGVRRGIDGDLVSARLADAIENGAGWQGLDPQGAKVDP